MFLACRFVPRFQVMQLVYVAFHTVTVFGTHNTVRSTYTPPQAHCTFHKTQPDRATQTDGTYTPRRQGRYLPIHVGTSTRGRSRLRREDQLRAGATRRRCFRSRATVSTRRSDRHGHVWGVADGADVSCRLSVSRRSSERRASPKTTAAESRWAQFLYDF